jgi:DMSO/TMAO reductase YedYZ molybdopterin-dependent catalytic subunit
MGEHHNFFAGRLPGDLKANDHLAITSAPGRVLSRRSLLRQIAVASASLAAAPAFANERIRLPLPSDPRERPLTHDFPQKAGMILQRIRPPLLETPIVVFDRGVFTPNDQFYVRWHWAVIPNSVDVNSFRPSVRGHVDHALSLSIQDILRLPRVEMAAVNQCSGNSRGLFWPRVPGAQWANGAMGNARWTGVRLKDVLDRAGFKAGAVQVRFKGLDEPGGARCAGLQKIARHRSCPRRGGDDRLRHDGEQLPLLNGFPLRLIVPGWYSTYWVKMLSDIEVLEKPDDNYWMAVAYTIPDTPHANIAPGQSGVKMVPLNRMVPRSFFTNLATGASIPANTRVPVRGIAFGGDTGVAKVELSLDRGKSWQAATLGTDHGKYSFLQWETSVSLPERYSHALMVRCTNLAGEGQPDEPNWNNSGFMRNVIEAVQVNAN